MKNSVVNIQLANEPLVWGSKGNNYSNSGRFGNGTKRLMIVKADLLMIALSNEACLITLNRSISMSFNFEHPFAINYILVGVEGISIHVSFLARTFNSWDSLTPFELFASFGKRGWFSMGRYCFVVRWVIGAGLGWLQRARLLVVMECIEPDGAGTIKGAGDLQASGEWIRVLAIWSMGLERLW
jgi:hypothetical protein